MEKKDKVTIVSLKILLDKLNLFYVRLIRRIKVEFTFLSLTLPPNYESHNGCD